MASTGNLEIFVFCLESLYLFPLESFFCFIDKKSFQPQNLKIFSGEFWWNIDISYNNLVN